MFGFTIVRTSDAQAQKSGPKRRATAAGLAEELAQRQARSAVNQVVVGKWVAVGAIYLIVVLSFRANFTHQRDFLAQHTTEFTSKAVPISLDALTLSCITLLMLPLIKSGRWVTLGGLLFATGCSSTLSALAPGDPIEKWVSGGMVLLIAVGKIVTSFAKIDFRQLFAQASAMDRVAGMGRPRGRTRSLQQRADSVAKAQQTKASKKADATDDKATAEPKDNGRPVASATGAAA